MGNAGQIVKEFLKSMNVNIDRLLYKRKGILVERRAKKKIEAKLSVATDTSNSKRLHLLANDIRNGKYSIGEEICPQRFQKMGMVDGRIVKEEFIVKGRKEPLVNIRKESIYHQENFYHQHYIIVKI